MRITKLPIPLLIAAAALTGVAVIYVYLTAPPMPIHTDPNFTTPLLTGVTYLWRGAAFQYVFSADNQITIAKEAPYHLIYLFGPLYNISLAGDRITIAYLANGRPLYVHKLQLYDDYGYRNIICAIFKLTDVTPADTTIGNLTMYLPATFNSNDVLTYDEFWTVARHVDCNYAIYTKYRRVIGIQSNGTHIIFRTAEPTIVSGEERYYLPLSSTMVGRTFNFVNNPISGSYIVSGRTFSVMALPYLHFSITPSGTTTLVIYVS
jgi:hypothetical protein